MQVEERYQILPPKESFFVQKSFDAETFTAKNTHILLIAPLIVYYQVYLNSLLAQIHNKKKGLFGPMKPTEDIFTQTLTYRQYTVTYWNALKRNSTKVKALYVHQPHMFLTSFLSRHRDRRTSRPAWRAATLFCRNVTTRHGLCQSGLPQRPSVRWRCFARMTRSLRHRTWSSSCFARRP